MTILKYIIYYVYAYILSFATIVIAMKLKLEKLHAIRTNKRM